ncbi:testis-specific serine/threonine-protein kinase 1-like [Anneissia japonica]|uniref:testis-specific serine/threonine-protein kinase 1-like n=1 Tax=Anneissia japonica TaxID=1529436 RepID=UPI00142574F7|nr:testis-specific serine/threonine-protein kinase 1-like [Anneissia japonica]
MSKQTTKKIHVYSKGRSTNRNLTGENSNRAVLNRHGIFLGDHIGKGSYSRVRLAVLERNMKTVAVKIIDRRKAPDDYQEKFLPRELEIITSLKHEHIVKTYQYFEENRNIYMIMEYLSGGDVLQYIQTRSRGPVCEGLAKRWIKQTIGGLMYLHGLNIAHRDVKCENLLLDDGSNVKITDFGFCKKMNPAEELSKTYCGSAAYAAPEIIRSIAYNPYISDIWALGVVCYVITTGTMPFGDDVKDVHKIVAAQSKPLYFIRTRAPSETCQNLIQSMLTVDVTKRATFKEILLSSWMSPDSSPTTIEPMKKVQRLLDTHLMCNLTG